MSGFLQPGADFFLKFSLHREEQQIISQKHTHTILLRCYHTQHIVGVGNKRQPAGSRLSSPIIPPAHADSARAEENVGGGAKKRQGGCFCPLVKPATLSTMTAGDRA